MKSRTPLIFLCAVFCSGHALVVPCARAQGAQGAPGAATSTPAPAETDDNQRARHFYELGELAYKEHKLEEARAHFLKAWSIRQTYDVASALGQCELTLKLTRDAAEHLDFAIRNFPPQLDRKILQQVRTLFSSAEQQVASVALSVEPPGADVSVDGQPVGVAPLARTVFLDPGRHTIAASMPGKQTASRELNAIAGLQQAITLTLSDAPLQAAPSTPPPQNQRGPSKVPLVIGGALTLIGAGVGVGYAVATGNSHDRADELRDTLPPGACATDSSSACSALREETEAHDRNRTISTIAFAVSATSLLATAGYWIIASSSSQPRPQSASAPFRVNAGLTSGGAALELSGAW